jgi:hypothetical protein
MDDLEHSIALNFYEAFSFIRIGQQDPLCEAIWTVKHIQIGLN